MSRSRPQTSSSVIGRTLACATIRLGASAPVPIIAKREASGRERYFAASADAAAVRFKVNMRPSISAKGWPSRAEIST